MYLQPYNNPRAGLYGFHKKLHSSSFNLATSGEPQASYPPRVSDENSSGQESPGPSGHQASIPARIHKAQSLDVLSEPWLQTQMEGEASTSDSRSRSLSQDSNESMFSDFSSGSESSSLKVRRSHTGHPASTDLPDASDSSGGSPSHSLTERRVSNTSSGSSGSVGSKTSEAAPRVPPRPKTEEILNRCTTMTRKAALATKTRLQHQPESIHSRL